MSDAIFDIDLAAIEHIDFDSPLEEAESRSCEHYFGPYFNAAVAAKEAGELSKAEAFELLCEMSGLEPKFDTPETPFAPRIIRGNGRSLGLQDIPKADRDAIGYLARKIQDPAMAARLYDISWVLNKRDVASGDAAAEAYLRAALLLIPERTWWIPAIKYFQRAFWISLKLGRDKPRHQSIVQALGDTLKTISAQENPVKLHKFLDLMQLLHCGQPEELAELAWLQAEGREAAKDFDGCRGFYELALAWYRTARNKERVADCLRKIAESFILEADISPEPYTRSLLLRSAIVAARQAKFDQMQLTSLHRALADAQQATIESITTITLASEEFEDYGPKIREHLNVTTLAESLHRLILVADLIDVDKLRENVEDIVGKNLFGHIFQRVQLDNLGRPNVIRNPIVGAKGADREAEIWREMFQEAQAFWEYRAVYLLYPAIRYVEEKFRPSVSDLYPLVRNNPFVTPGHEMMILRGILAGFNNDFLLASVLLVPQVEQMMRHALQANGVDVSTFEKDGTQLSKVFGGIFALKATEPFFGKSLCFELRGHLIEKTGYDLRNRIAHGFALDGELMSARAVSLWWIVLNMLICGLMPRPQVGRDGTADNSADRGNSEGDA